MSKETRETEFKITTKEEVVLYEGFSRVMAVKSFSGVDAHFQYERTGVEEWKCKFYKPTKNS